MNTEKSTIKNITVKTIKETTESTTHKTVKDTPRNTVKDYQAFCELLIKENPNITPAEMCHNMHLGSFGITDCACALHKFFPGESTDARCQVLLGEFFHPLFEKKVYKDAMLQAGEPEADVAAALEKNYPADTNRYALKLEQNTVRPDVAENACFDFGTLDFTVEAWIQTTGSGTVISKKGAPGGPGNGGFLLVIKPSGSIKFATDDGFGFYEINTVETAVSDGNWHHILATRSNSELSIYLDFQKTDAAPRTNRFPGLDVSNSLRLLIGATDQWQEEYNTYSGLIGEVRVWDASVTYDNVADWEQTDRFTPHLCGCWSFFGKQAGDCSDRHLAMNVPADVSYVSWELPR